MNSISSLFSLEGETALITGGTRGIGQAIALALAESGANTILVQRDKSNTTTRDAVEALGKKSTIYVADLSSSAEVGGLIPSILKDGHKISILVNCAGIQYRSPSSQFPSNAWDEVLQVNLTSVFNISRDVGAHMLTLEPSPVTGRRGSIINVASLLSFQGGFTVPAYAASKGGVAQLTKAFANEWASHGITVNAIAPGYVETEMNSAILQNETRLKSIHERIPAGRWGQPDDFKGSVIYLASRASSYVNGHVLTIDGGWMGR
ncbi:2-dehydro-3-deoxy-D-gluconate 5-dehydrogenase [Erysiphe neolycopersici]|uniref:2-dehydro-3-deoxy-D-gluconate 5-dehydrogenase n=1 Tax=Erysiphe neolycopersici TaxID=212602 RepID=A0A420HP42_9PEZI|nr:2-dehydro-3-deoxy-D-gluconate 5-dehydrogenase [Erysiphe neolycopersici]